MLFFGYFGKTVEFRAYSFKNISLLLDGWVDKSDEQIVELYLKKGSEFIDELRGEFRLCLVDNKTILLATDHLATKQIYYIDSGDFFAFSSNISKLKPYLKTLELNNDALLSYLSFLTPTPPHTFYKHIKKLPPASLLTYNKQGVSVSRYFNILDIKTTICSEDEALQKLEKVLCEAIELRKTPKSTSLLSGGIDSATINYFLKPTTTYTIQNSETPLAIKSAEFLGLELKVLDIKDMFDEVDELFDEPLNDPAALPLFHMLKQVKSDGYTRVFSGEGSDELFLGYRQYREFLELEGLKNLKQKGYLSSFFHSHFSMSKEWERHKRAFDGSLIFRGIGENFTDLQKNHLLKQNIKDNQALSYINHLRDMFVGSKDESFWYSFLDLEQLPAKTKLDTISQKLNLEITTPFLDKEVIKTTFSLTPSIRLGERKRVLKNTMKPYLSHEILSRRKKGFSSRFYEYLLEDDRVENIIKTNKRAGLFKEKELKNFIEDGKKGLYKNHLWSLYMLSIWLDKNF